MVSTLREFRERSGLSQTALGDRIGLSKGGLSRVETGSRLPSIEVAVRLVEALSLTAAEALALLRELAGLPPQAAAEPPPPAGLPPLLLGEDLVELLDLRSSDDGTWWATVRTAHTPHATARRVRLAAAVERRAA